MRDLEGKTAVITGAASGMGRAFADRLARAGMRVVLADIEPAPLQAAVAELETQGATAIGVVIDVSSEHDMAALRTRSLEHFGAVDVVCLNAGVAGGTGPMETLTVGDWQWTLGVNLWGIIHGIHTFVPDLKRNDSGHVVITASIVGLTSFPNMGPYNVTKHSAVAIAETLFSELRDQGSSVGVSCLCPGVVHTNIITSERNRPEALRRTLLEPERTNEDIDRGRASYEIFLNAKPPHEVAELVHDAIVERRFWILTDEVFTPEINRRLDAIRDRADPTARGTLLDVYYT
ncbi:MAG TPA: SDR family NAD(P)-dependent oxidoreductase [Acidimicrobiales bacterium]|nr:SDR family NAD(P)-dependent oxidoreductase [Acidimicrobiales bacterium]